MSTYMWGSQGIALAYCLYGILTMQLKTLPTLALLAFSGLIFQADAQSQSWAQMQVASAQTALPVEDAFKLRVLTSRSGEISVRWDMPEGYYLYSSRLKFTAANGLRVGAPVWPNGVMKNDPHLGRVEVYRNQLITTLSRESPSSGTLTVRFQGCAEKQNICYPPVTRSFRIPAISS